ncbi:MAG: hypothetical protein KatS3mg032_1752 [Cyclobacteriaceae bacterium]|nr:MAG: hypothetical protein KatS3mg032_1752 [Cyclobacteriaceae bacterium]
MSENTISVKREVIIWLFLLIAFDLIQYYLNNTLITKEIITSELANYLDTETASQLAERSQSGSRILFKHITHMFLTGLKVIGTIILLYAGLFFSRKQQPINNLLESVLKCYPAFFIVGYIQFIYFGFFQDNYTYLELNSFNPFSFTSIISLTGPSLQGKAAAFFNAFSMLDVIFCWLLSQELNKESEKPVTATVFIAYFTGLALWKSIILLLVP